MAEGAADVVAAVRFARDLGVGVTATGHGVGAVCDGGAPRTDVVPEARAHGLAGLVGSSHVGVVGYTMGGGFR